MQSLGKYGRKLALNNFVSTIPWGLAAALVLFLNACSASSFPASSQDVYNGTKIDGTAPDFRLTDQNGKAIALSEFPNKVIVLTFLDTQCKEMCPLTASHLRSAARELGSDATSVVFLGVNVNVEANTSEDVAATTEKWHLDEIPNWHYLTGKLEELRPVWEAYNIEVEPATDGRELVHSTGVYIIDRNRQERWYVSTPFVEAGTPAPSLPLSELLVSHIRELLNQS